MLITKLTRILSNGRMYNLDIARNIAYIVSHRGDAACFDTFVANYNETPLIASVKSHTLTAWFHSLHTAMRL